MSVLLIITVPLSFLLPLLLEAFNVDDLVISETRLLLFGLMPAMFFRTIGDSMRSLLQGMGYMTPLGFLNLLNIAVFIPYAYLLVTKIGNPLLGYGLALAIYEFIGVL